MRFRVKSFETFTGRRKWYVYGPHSEIRGMYVDWNLAIKVANALANDHEYLRRYNPVAFWNPDTFR
jgi:hypothetical protein